MKLLKNKTPFMMHMSVKLVSYQIHILLNLTSLFLLSHQTIGTKPIAHIDQFTPEMLGTAELAEEVSLDGSGKLVKVTYII